MVTDWLSSLPAIAILTEKASLTPDVRAGEAPRPASAPAFPLAKGHIVRLHPSRRSWDDLSDFVVHFTRDIDDPAAYNFVSILRDGRIEARNKFGLGRGDPNCPPSVCFSEAPLHRLKRVAGRRGGPFGIGFHKEFAVRIGGGPILYAYSDIGDATKELVARAAGDPNDPIWRLASFVDQPSEKYAFEWEREWRVPGDVIFRPGSIRFLTAPEAEHGPIRNYFAELEETEGFPPYRCPMIDLDWDLARIQEEVKS